MTAIAAKDSKQDNGVNPKEGIDLEYVETVLVKFTVSSRDEVAPSIPARKRLSQAELDARHIEQAKDLVKQGRIAERKIVRGSTRPGHVDTGAEVYYQELGVGAPTLPECLAGAGYGIRDAHFFAQSKGKRTDFVIGFAFEYGADDAENAADLKALYARYAAGSWTVSIWDNPNLVTTVNHTNRVEKERPLRKVVSTKKRLFITK